MCRPFDARRSGISIGEAAGFALLERRAPATVDFVAAAANRATPTTCPRRIPRARRAAGDARALAAAAARGADIGYVNVHGTATPANDAAEAARSRAVFGRARRAGSSTKGVTGHTLGAAGVVEAMIAVAGARAPGLPPCGNMREPTPDLALDCLVTQPARRCGTR